MLYVFQMDVGQMLTFEISLLMDTVATLQQELARVTGIGVDKQILLVSGGHSLKPQQKVISYGAGTDTNPVFLFSKQAIESQEPPLVKSFGVAKEVLSALKERITEAINLPPGFETVARRTKVACEIRDNANRMLAFCSNEFKEQHLQYQGWGTVVANLEEIAQAMQKTESKFKKAFTAFIPLREKHFSTLENFQETISLLDRIPLLKSLKESQKSEVLTKRSQDEGIISFVASSGAGPSTLLEWITTQGQGQSIEVMQHKCYDDLLMFDSEMFSQLDREVQEQLSLVMSDPHHMKELVGIERRLSELEKRLNEAKRIAQEQNDMAQGFLKQQARLSSTQSPALILPDLCRSHQQQLRQMLDRQQRIETLQSNFMKSKQEMSTNIHQRLGWVMHIETQISKLDSDLIYHLKTLRILECNLELLNQIRAAPQVYADMVVEAARRRVFSARFLQWASSLVDDSKQLYISETERRKQFARKLGEHFLLHTLFKGFEDMPPSFATKPPQPFDTLLPEITVDDIVLLKSSVPELEEYLNVTIDAGSFSLNLLSKGMMESPRLQMVIPQSSQTEWSDASDFTTQPSIVMATEAPPAKFTLPEAQESHTAEHVPAGPSLTEVVKNVVTASAKPVGDHSPAKGSEATSESSSSVAVYESGSVVQSVKTQTKTNSTHTDSTSPISSNEFATADFYFEDSMPSPMADSPLDKKEEKKMESSKTETVASLQAELSEKVALIKILEQKLRDKEAQLSDSEKLSSQKGSSTDESATMVGTTDVSEIGVTSSSGDAVSTESNTAVNGADKGDVSSYGQAEMCLEGSTSVDKESTVQDSDKDVLDSQTFKIRILEQEHDLAKLKESLAVAENRLQELQDQSDKALLDKESLVMDLQNQVKTLNEELAREKDIAVSRNEDIKDLEKSLSEAKAVSEKLEHEVKSGDESLERIKSKLLDFREKLRIDLPAQRQSLAEMKDSVLSNRANLDQVVASALSSVEKHVSLFSSSILADANAEYEKENERLRSEVQQLKLDLNESQSEAKEKVIHLTSKNEELASQADKLEQEFAKRSEEQRRDFDAALRDMETKHALEMEIELDRVRAEEREEVERLSRIKDDLSKEVCEVKETAQKQKEDLERAHREEVDELQVAHAREKELTVGFLNEKFQSGLTEKEQEKKVQVAELEAKLESMQACLVSEKTHAIAALTEQLAGERESASLELRQQRKEHEANLADVLEKTQLDHAKKLTEMKIHFDMERESLIAEVSKLKNWEKSHIESQTERHLLAETLTNSDTQTEIVHVSEIMTHSETQTGMELLAEVISLTSSASYGSEEMIAHKQLSTLTDEKDGRETESTIKLQQTIDDLNVQLAGAHEKLAILEREIATLYMKQQDMGGSRTVGHEDEASHIDGATASHKEFMRTNSVNTSFMVMDKEPSSLELAAVDAEAMKAKDKKIAQLEKKLMELSMTASEREVTADKVSIRGCDKGDLVLLCLDEGHDQYVVFTVGTVLHFLHSESHETLGLKTSSETACRKSWILAEVVDKEYCLAKKPNNRFRVPQGTCFYRVKCKPWKCDPDLGRQERGLSKLIKTTKPDFPATGGKAKKSEKGDSAQK